MNKKEIRWKQRFENFSKSFLQLEKAVEMGPLSDVERAGLIQFFEISFELAWKTLKDFIKIVITFLCIQ